MAGKTNDQIRREFDARSPLAKLGIAADDLVRIAASGVTGGLVDDWTGSAAQTQEARVRAGLAGDVANVAGMGLGLKGAGSIAKGAIGAARALPTAVNLAKVAGPATAARYLTGTAGPGLVATGAKLSRGALAKGAGALGLLGLSVAGRQDDSVTPVAAPVRLAPKAAATPAAAAAVDAGGYTPEDYANAQLQQMLSKPLTINEFEKLSGTLPTVASVAAKGPKPKDVALSNAMDISQLQARAEMEAASKLYETDPEKGAEARAKATDKYVQNLLSVGGVNLQQLAQAQMLAQAQAERDD